MTDKNFPGNLTRSYRIQAGLKIVDTFSQASGRFSGTQAGVEQGTARAFRIEHG